MYIMNERAGMFVNTDYIRKIFLTDTSDSVLLSMQWDGVDKPVTLERYRDRKEAEEALNQLFRAISDKAPSFYMPESSYYFEEHLIKDARIKRKGGS